MVPTVPETNKQPGVCYAVTDDGLELPIIDITNPAFAFAISEAELSGLIDQFVRSLQLRAQGPTDIMQALAKQSILVRGFAESAGTYTTGMMTYLNKLGPDNLGAAWAGPIDRQWAAGLTPVTFRWRMRDLVRLLAESLTQAAARRPAAPVHLVNIGGGPAMDSLNALIVVQKEQPGLLAGRDITLHVLDLDSSGPNFGARALDALLAAGAPLDGLSVRFDAVKYDWTNPAVLRRLIDDCIDPDVDVAAGSTEGGLFEYASDQDIIANLEVLHAGTPTDFAMAGPVVRNAATMDPRLRVSENVPGAPAIRYMGLDKFMTLATGAGWQLDRVLDGPMHQVVRLVK